MLHLLDVDILVALRLDSLTANVISTVDVGIDRWTIGRDGDLGSK